VLGATPHEFESRILRHSQSGRPTSVSAGQSNIRPSEHEVAGRSRDRPTFSLRVSTAPQADIGAPAEQD